MKKRICFLCNGTGKVKCEDYGLCYGRYDHSDVTINGPCPLCGGGGIILCPECGGTGILSDDDD